MTSQGIKILLEDQVFLCMGDPKLLCGSEFLRSQCDWKNWVRLSFGLEVIHYPVVINGLIFYANIVGVNSVLFFPPGETDVLTVFISWLNLTFGIEVCFFDEMKVYMQ